MWDLIVKNGKVVTQQGTVTVTLLIKDGKIVAMVAEGADIGGIVAGIQAGVEVGNEVGSQAQQVVDATGKYVIPGMVDAHVHIGEPGKSEKEEISTGTQSAAAGGVTTIMLMPNSIPPVNSVESLESRRDLFNGKSFVDFALLGGAGAELAENIVPQAHAGAVGYKSYIRAYTPSRKGLICQDAGDVYVTLKEVAHTGRRVGFHAEDASLIKVLTHELQNAGKTGFQDFHPSRPESTEIISTLILLEVALLTGAPLHLVHMSSPRAIELARQWKEWGADLSVETCPHYLLFSDEETAEWGPYAQVVPPLRSPEAVEALWDLVNEGFVDIIATDHAPGLPGEKEIGKHDIFASGGGLPGFETTLPALFDQVNRGRMSLELLSSITAEKPARLFGLYPRKGALMPGADADFNIVDMDKTITFDIEKMYTKGKDAARIFHGRTVQGAIEKTFLRGQLIAENGRIVGSPESGLWIPPVDL